MHVVAPAAASDSTVLYVAAAVGAVIVFGALALIIKAVRARSKVLAAKQWHFFLSHTQRNGEAVAMATSLFHSFKDMDKKCWLDVQMPKMDMEAMKDGVNGSR